jgi:DNA topoisomerase-2
VNSICTSKGGTHINYVSDKIVGDIMDELASNKKYKGVEVQKY